jgi:hypothetical protein
VSSTSSRKRAPQPSGMTTRYPNAETR